MMRPNTLTWSGLYPALLPPAPFPQLLAIAPIQAHCPNQPDQVFCVLAGGEPLASSL